MDKQPQSRGPLIVAMVLLLLPVLYVASYFALMIPGVAIPVGMIRGLQLRKSNYRCGGQVAAQVFWPLEQIDRKVRPEARAAFH